MSLYDVVKDAISVAQKADNIELIKQLLEIGQMANDLQNENTELKRKLNELEAIEVFEGDMEPQLEPYFTLKSDSGKVERYFCSTCWGNNHKKIQMWFNGEYLLHCPACNAQFSICPRKRSQQITY